MMRPKSIYWGIFLGSFFLYLLFSHHLPITDPVESNYVLTAKEMVQTSDWLSPRIYGNVWYDKPVFFYWLTAISFKLFGFSELAARLVPALFAAAGLAFNYWFVSKVSGRSTAFVATVVMGTSLEYVILAKLIITDMVFFVFNCTALAFFYLGYSNKHTAKRWYFGMYVSLALAVLTKGPIGLLLPGLVVIIFIGIQRKWTELKEMSITLGALLFAGVTLPWYGAMYAVHGADFLNTFLGVHNYLRATVSEHPNDNVIYYYFVVFFLSMLPWSALALKGIVKGYKDWRSKSSSVSLFCLIWASVYFGFYSLMATKYLTYIFPIVFPVSILTARYLDQLFVQRDTKTVMYWGAIPCAFLAVGYMVMAGRYLAGAEMAITVTCLLAVMLCIWWQARGKDAKQIFGLLCISQVAFIIILSIGVFPEIAESRSGKDIAGVISEANGSRIGLYQFYSTSSVYYSGNIAVKLQPSETLAVKQPDSLGWSKKYTMPVQTLNGFVGAGKENILIIVPDKVADQFAEEARYLNPKLLKSDEEYRYYTF